jgi:Na+/proline symporter
MQTDTRRTLRPYVCVLAALWGLPALAVGVGYVALPKEHAGGGCEGIGFGCTPAPADSVVLLGVLAAGPLLLTGLVAVVIVAAVQSWRAGRRR